MNPLEERAIDCPHCGENFTILIDCTLAEQSYIEDCYVCCQPIQISVDVDNYAGQGVDNLSLQVEPAQ